MSNNKDKLYNNIGYKRFTQLIKNVDISNFVYVYGKRDMKVGASTKKEIEFLQRKNVKIIAGHKRKIPI